MSQYIVKVNDKYFDVYTELGARGAQEELSNLGYKISKDDKVDGIWGRRSTNAYKDYKSKKGINEAGLGWNGNNSFPLDKLSLSNKTQTKLQPKSKIVLAVNPLNSSSENVNSKSSQNLVVQSDTNLDYYPPSSFTSSELANDSSDTEQLKLCASFVTNVFLKKFGNRVRLLGITGDAWTMGTNIVRHGGSTIFDLYSEPEFTSSSFSEYPGSSYINKLTRDVIKKKGYYKDRFKDLLIGDIVGIYYEGSRGYGSSYMQRAFTESGNTPRNTHIGFVGDIDSNGNPIIYHNIGGRVYKDTLTDGKVSYGFVVSAFAPNYYGQNYDKNENNNGLEIAREHLSSLDFINQWYSDPVTRQKYAQHILQYGDSPYYSYEAAVQDRESPYTTIYDPTNASYLHNGKYYLVSPYTQEGGRTIVPINSRYDSETMYFPFTAAFDVNTIMHELIHKYFSNGFKYKGVYYPRSPMFYAIGNILKEENWEKKDPKNEFSGYAYDFDPNELYSELMAMRKTLKLKPGLVITEQWVNEHRNELPKKFYKLPAKIIVRLNNEVAYNDNQSSEMLLAKKGAKLLPKDTKYLKLYL